MGEYGLREGLLLGCGNPLLDISAVVDKEFLDKYGMKPNDAILADERHKNLNSELISKYQAEFIAGGSCQNVLRVAQWFFEKPKVATFFGAVGTDEYSKTIEKCAKENGVNVRYQYCEDVPTGTCAVLITDKHRSLCANLAAANHFTIDHVQKSENRKFIEMAQFYYITGFFITVSPPTIMEIAKYALAHNRPFVMNLSAPFVSQFYKETLMEILPYVDILIGNESEAETFSKEQNLETTDLKEIAEKICNLPKQNENRSRVCIITQGPHSVILAHKGKITEFPVKPIPEEEMVDTNGAGDAFSGGFLAQLVLGQPFDVCIECGVWAASQIIKNSGCTFHGKPSFRA